MDVWVLEMVEGMTADQYRYKCPTEGCEIDTIIVNVHEDVIKYFGFCCPFCQDHMVRDDTYQSEREKVLDELKKRQRESYMKANTPTYSLEFVNIEAHGMAVAFRECIELLGGTPIPIEELYEELRQAGEP